MRALGINVRVTGDHWGKDKNFIILSNHQSTLDFSTINYAMIQAQAMSSEISATTYLTNHLLRLIPGAG